MKNYRIIEENVDGCDGSASVFVQCEDYLADGDIERLSSCLEQAKEDHVDDDYCTDDFVEAAIEEFNKSADKAHQLKMIEPPYVQAIFF